MTVLPKVAVKALFEKAVLSIVDDNDMPTVIIENPKQAAHGDYAVNTAMVLAKVLKKSPVDIARLIIEHIPENDMIDTLEIAGPGFINIRLKAEVKQAIAETVLAQANEFGHNQTGERQSVIIEFVSANPTGPLHVGHGRQGAIGDALSNIFAANGYQVHREFYYNDAGNQINNLMLSVQARAKELKGEVVSFPEDGYHGEYIIELAKAYIQNDLRDVNDADAIRRFAVAELRKEQDLDLKAFGICFDEYYLESSLYTNGSVEQTVEKWQAQDKIYEKEGAIWLKTTDYGDDKDRVVRKSDGSYTYFVPDVAYHVTKFKRGFDQAVNIQGTDHFGTIARVRAGLQALNIGIPEGYPDYVLHSMVKVMRNGQEVKISKRAGGYVTVRDLIDEVGKDAVRFFLVSRKADSEFIFDIDLALSQSEDNPVFYVQYAHARICSVLAQADIDISTIRQASLAALTSEKEMALLLKLAEYPEKIIQAQKDLAPHLIAFYVRELASDFHGYYNAERVLVDDEAIKMARLKLYLAIAQTLQNGLAMLGVSAPQKM